MSIQICCVSYMFELPFRRATFIPELNKFLRYVKPDSKRETHDSVSAFFKRRGVMIMALHGDSNLVGLATLVPVPEAGEASARLEEVLSLPEYQPDNIHEKLMAEVSRQTVMRSLNLLATTS